MPDSRSASRPGLLYGVAAYTLWGTFPLYWPLLEPAGALEILAHRVLWSLLVVAGLVLVVRRRRSLPPLGVRRTGMLVAAATFLAVNWGTYIWGVNHGHVVETSLGYFINPLVTVLLAVVVLGERLRRRQLAAIGVAFVAVLVLTVDHGRPPWIALVLAVSFGSYGLLKKTANVGSVQSLFVETVALTPVTVAYLLAIGLTGGSTFASHGAGHGALLALAGPVTVVPLLLFASSANRIPLTTLGLLQYLTPTIQFLIGVLDYGEPMPPARLAGFALIWAALAVFASDTVGEHRRRRATRPERVESHEPALS